MDVPPDGGLLSRKGTVESAITSTLCADSLRTDSTAFRLATALDKRTRIRESRTCCRHTTDTQGGPLVATPSTRIMDVLDFIEERATTAEILAITLSLEARQERDFATRVAGARIGRPVTVQDATPAYLDGVTGVIVDVQGDDVTIELDANSAGYLRFHPEARTDGYAPAGPVALLGVDARCCITEDNYVLAAAN